MNAIAALNDSIATLQHAKQQLEQRQQHQEEQRKLQQQQQQQQLTEDVPRQPLRQSLQNLVDSVRRRIGQFAIMHRLPGTDFAAREKSAKELREKVESVIQVVKIIDARLLINGYNDGAMCVDLLQSPVPHIVLSGPRSAVVVSSKCSSLIEVGEISNALVALHGLFVALEGTVPNRC